MAEIVRDKTGRVLFTKQMREEGYTILAPNMLPVHFKLFAKAFQQAGYNVVPLTSSGRRLSTKACTTSTTIPVTRRCW